MMKPNAVEKYSSLLERGVIQSLYYLYQELMKENQQDLASIIEKTILDCEKVIRKQFSLSQEEEDIFKLFHVLQKFRQLSKEQKDFLTREIGYIQTEH